MTLKIKKLQVEGFEKVLHGKDDFLKIDFLGSVHNTTLGPGLGGVRRKTYLLFNVFPSFKMALDDVLALSVAMTKKAAVANLNLGGAKAVIFDNPQKDKIRTEAEIRKIFHCFGEFVNAFEGQYITAEDVGTTPPHMIYIKEVTPWVTGLPLELGGSGDPSPVTAYGVQWGLRALMEEVYGTSDFANKIVAVTGIVGKVGSNLVKLLLKEGAIIIGADIREKEAKEMANLLNIRLAKPKEIHKVKCHIFSPNGFRHSINSKTINELRCDIIGGAENNQLAKLELGQKLHQIGILYGPDFLINAGGLINVNQELLPGGYSRDKALIAAQKIYERMKLVIEISKRKNISTHLAAEKLAEARIDQVKFQK